MTISNKLTIFRILLMPLIVIAMLDSSNNVDILNFKDINIIALLIFILASFTDFLDGYLARKLNQITTFGKFMDPLADKLLTTSVLLVFMDLDKISFILIIVIISREFMVSGIRLLATTNGKVIAASIWGKLKTFLTMFFIISLFLNLDNINNYFAIVVGVITIVGGLEYLLKNKDIILESK